MLINSIRNIINNYGITVVVAAGNERQNAANTSPARTPEAITVGAYDDRNNILASFSNFGTLVDLQAPGVNIRSCWLNNGYRVLSGTSMAAPMVAGPMPIRARQRPSRPKEARRMGLIVGRW